MEKFALSLISFNPPGSPSAENSDAKNIGDVVNAQLKTFLLRLPNTYQPVQFVSVGQPEEVMEAASLSLATLLSVEVSHIDHVAKLAQLMRKMKAEIQSGRLRIIVHFKIDSTQLLEKLKLGGRTEVISDLSKTEAIGVKAKSLVEFLLLQKEARTASESNPSSLEMAFKLSQWMAQTSMDTAAFTHLFSSYLRALCGGSHVEFMRRDSDGWRCVGTSDGKPSIWLETWNQQLDKQGNLTQDSENLQSAKLKTAWVGSKKAAWVYQEEQPLSPEQLKVLQAAVELADEFGVTGMASDSSQPETVLSTSGLNH